MAKTGTRVPPREEYVRRLAEALALPRRELPEEGFRRLWQWKRLPVGYHSLAAFRDEILTDLVQALRGTGYNLMTALHFLAGCGIPGDVSALSARLTAELVEHGGANPAHNPNLALAKG
jgi:hypothetical protein